MTKDRKVLKTNFVNMLRILGVQVQGLDLSPGLNELKKDFWQNPKELVSRQIS